MTKNAARVVLPTIILALATSSFVSAQTGTDPQPPPPHKPPTVPVPPAGPPPSVTTHDVLAAVLTVLGVS